MPNNRKIKKVRGYRRRKYDGWRKEILRFGRSRRKRIKGHELELTAYSPARTVVTTKQIIEVFEELCFNAKTNPNNRFYPVYSVNPKPLPKFK